MDIEPSGIFEYLSPLQDKMQVMCNSVMDDETYKSCTYAARCLAALRFALENSLPVFGVEPWHPVHPDAALSMPGEMLLRLKDENAQALPPYPAVMTFYENGLAVDLDTVLFLSALHQFAHSTEKQISVNVSGRSMRDASFIRVALNALESLDLVADRKIIIEIHESEPSLKMSPLLLKLFRRAGVLFAIDDVGLSMNDVIRLAEFENIADFIKLDRQCVCAAAETNVLETAVSFITSALPGAVLVAEGVQNAEHARALHTAYPQIRYVQGLYLPPRDVFAKEWAAL
jgi:EAL domain-containing protein (putative c-di-GMP-specific phosphodiesterase class I)